MSLQTLLCIANYPSNTGYAWDFIEQLYARVANRLQPRQIRTLVAYPEIPSPPRTLRDSAAIPVLLNASLGSYESIRSTVRFIRRENIRVVYFTDRMVRDFSYLLIRWAGVRYIVVHDHTSGEWSRPKGPKYWLKWLLARVPGINADAVIAVSDYVARRQLDIGLVPKRKLIRIWNGLTPVPLQTVEKHSTLCRQLGFDDASPVVLCSCRATAVKGVANLLRAFDRAVKQMSTRTILPVLLYVGDGPQFSELREIRDSLAVKDRVVLAGYSSDIQRMIELANICVVPSLWQDALPLAVLEPMAMGKPVIATAVGGVPEMIEHNRSGILVPPGDEISLANAITEILVNPNKAKRLGEAARERVAEHFGSEQQISSLVSILTNGFDL